MASTGEAFGLFWDSENGDRTYSAASFEYWLKKFFTSGVFNGDLQVKATSGMTLEVEAGYTNADGKVKFWNAPFNVTLDAANSTYPRIDTVVIRRDNVNRQITCEKVTGAYSGDTPQPTPPTRNSEIFELVIAQIEVGAGVTGITQSNITDTRPNNELCGYITGTVEELDFSAFTAQFEAYFAEFKRNQMADFQAWEVAQQAAYAAWFSLVQQQQIQDKADWDAWYAALQEELHELPEDTAEYLQIEIDEIRTSGTTGSILKITTTETSLEGKTVTVTNGTETRTATFDENLECLIAGYKGTGEVTISSSDGIQTATTVVTIPYFGNYTYNIAFWAATVNIQGDDNLKGATITVKDSDDLTVGTVVLNVITGRGVFNASKADTYTFNYSYQGTDYSESLIVDEQITYNLSLSAGFNWRGWVDTARFLDSTDYNSLDEVLEDEEAVRELCLEHACVDYMAKVASTNEELETVINNDLFAKWVNNSDYALDFLGANAVIKALMDEADKYFYGEWALMPQVPTMTSNTTPYGEAFSTATHSSGPAYYAFANDASISYVGTTNGASAGEYVGYHHIKPISVKKATASFFAYRGYHSTIALQGSHDNSTWNDISEEVEISSPPASSGSVINDIDFTITDFDAYEYHRIIRKANTPYATGGDYDFFYVSVFKMYDWQPKGNVPVMTASNAPYGEASSKDYLTSGQSTYYAYHAFNDDNLCFVGTSTNTWMQYKFVNPVCVKEFLIASNNSDRTAYIIVQGSNDGFVSDTHDLTSEILTTTTPTKHKIENDNYYLYYRIYCNRLASSYAMGVLTLQFYGRELSVSVPTMTSNTAPYGVASASSYIADNYAAWKAFTTSNIWYPNKYASNMIDEYIQYEFIDKIVLRGVYSIWGQDTGTSVQNTWTVLGSNDNFVSDVNEIQDITIDVSPYKKLHDISNDTPYKSYRLRCKTNPQTSGSNHFGLRLQFYGVNYSEKEFETGTTRKWLYDHGVELEELYTYGNSGSVTKEHDQLKLQTTANTGIAIALAKNVNNLGNYNLVRTRTGKVLVTSSADSHYGHMSIYPNNNPTSASGVVATGGIMNTAIPNNPSLDISSIANNNYPAVQIAETTRTKTSTIAEWWLE